MSANILNTKRESKSRLGIPDSLKNFILVISQQKRMQ